MGYSCSEILSAALFPSATGWSLPLQALLTTLRSNKAECRRGGTTYIQHTRFPGKALSRVWTAPKDSLPEPSYAVNRLCTETYLYCPMGHESDYLKE
ncbi:TPA: hypothetical protein ACH3X1_011420 [Trebouxia sp. C0004]